MGKARKGGTLGGLDFHTATILWEFAVKAYGRWRYGDPRADWAFEEIVRLAEAARH